jgi:hypothetical protein
MFWQFLAVLIAAPVLIYLGSLSVWVTVLAMSVKALLALIIGGILGFAGYLLWRKHQADRRRLIEFKP